MQLLSALIEAATPYAHFLWLVPAALFLYFFGWLVRGIELNATITNHEQALSSRDLKLKRLTSQLKDKDKTIADIKQYNSETHAIKLHEHDNPISSQAVFQKDNSETSDIQNKRTSMQRKFDEQTIRLEHTQRKLHRYTAATKEYEERFRALKTKYKQRDAKLYGEIVELRASVLELKARNLEKEKESNLLRDTASDLVQANTNLKGADSGSQTELKHKESAISSLKEKCRQLTLELENSKLESRTNNDARQSAETSLEKTTEKIKNLNIELQYQREQSELLSNKLETHKEHKNDKLDELTAEHEKLTRKYDNLKTESRREISSLKTNIKYLSTLSVVNKNQSRTIQTIQSKLQEQQRQSQKFQNLASDLVSTRAELQKVKLQLEKSEHGRNTNSKHLDTLKSKLSQSQFENRKIASLSRLVRQQDDYLHQVNTELSHFTDYLPKTSDNKFNMLPSILAVIKSELQKKKELALQLTQKDIELVKLNTMSEELSQARKKQKSTQRQLDELVTIKESFSDQSSKLLHSEKKISELDEQIQAYKQTIAQMNTSLASFREKADQVTGKDKSISHLHNQLNTANRLVAERNQEIAKLKTQNANSIFELEEKIKRLQPLQQALVQSEKKFKSAAAETNKLRVQLAEFAEMQNAMQNQERLQLALDSAEDHNRKLKEQIDRLQADAIEHANLTKEVAHLSSLQPELEQAENRVKQLESEIKSIQVSALEKSDQVVMLEHKLKSLSDTEHVLQQTQADLERASSRAETLEQQLIGLRSHSESDSATINRLESRVKELAPLEVQLVQSNEKIKMLSADIDQHLKDAIALQNLQNENQQLHATLLKQDDLQDQLMRKAELISRKDNEIETLKQSILLHERELQTQIDSKNARENELKTTIDAQEHNLSSLKQKLATVQKSERQLQDNTDILNQELSKLRSTNQHQKDEIALADEYKREIAHLQQKIDSLARLESDYMSLTQRLDEREQRITQLNAELRKIPELEKSIREKSDQLEKLNHLPQEIKEKEITISKISNELKQIPNLKQQLLNQQSNNDQVTLLSKQLQSQNEQLKQRSDQLDSATKHIEQQKVSILQLQNLLSSAKKSASEQPDNLDSSMANSITPDSDLTALNNKIKSLTKERDLGLQRVKELSESAKLLAEREKQIKQLKLEVTDTRIYTREIESLRAKVQRFELELQNKNLAIEELKKILRDQRKTQSHTSSAKGPAVKKTSTVKNQAVKQMDNRLTAKSNSKDDLKKIHGIGPVLEKLLNENGITRYQQIADLSASDINRLEESLDSFPGRIKRDNWVSNARKEQQKKYGSTKA